MENEGKTRIRSTAQQLKLLTDYMQTHPRLAHGEFSTPQGRQTENRQWEELRAMLSEHGPDKSIDRWKVTWRDLRRKARTEGSVARRAANSTGNATVVPVLTEQTIKILGIMGKEEVFGIQGGEESGIGSTPAALSGMPAPVDLSEDTIVKLSFDENESYYDTFSEGTAQDPSQQGARPSSGQHRPRLPLNETAQDPSQQGARPSSEHHRPRLPLNETAQDPSQQGARPSSGQHRPRLPLNEISYSVLLGPAQDPSQQGARPSSGQHRPRLPLNETAQDQSQQGARPSSGQHRPRLPLNETAQDQSQQGARPSSGQHRPRLSLNETIPTSTTTTNERQQAQRRQDPRARANQFLEAELQTNNILREVAYQLAIANRHSAIRSRLTYKEKLWRLRKDLFK